MKIIAEKNVPAIDNELSAVIVSVGQILNRVTVFFKFIHAGEDSADHIAVRIVFAGRKASPYPRLTYRISAFQRPERQSAA